MENKELTFQEVIANIKEGEIYESTNDVFKISKISMDRNKGINFKGDGSLENVIGINPNQRFIRVQKPVTFEEVLKSDNTCRIEHSLIGEHFEFALEKNYYTFSTLMELLSKKMCSSDLRKVLLEAKWYLED